MRRPSEPTAPDPLPKYIAKVLPKQDCETLEEFIEYAKALIDYRHQLDEQPIQEEDLSGDVEVLEESSKGAVYKLRVCQRWRPENTF